MNPDLFLSDLEAKPAALRELAAVLRRKDPFQKLPPDIERVLFLGMGSSRYAAGVAALRLRAAGIDAVAEYASALPYPTSRKASGPGVLVVAVSASGGSRETVEAVASVEGPVVVITNDEGSALASEAGLVVPMMAGEERGGVACRTFQHTLALLLALEARLTGGGPVVPLVRKAAEATADLLDRRSSWLPRTLELLDGPHGVYTIAPADRLSSAEQSALMVREGPRRPADACETGDWAHVDVYLTKTLDYRALLFPGSRHDEQAMDWIRRRESTVVAVGGEVAGAASVIRYKHDEDPLVRLLTETLVAEVVAAHWWRLVS